MMNLPKLDWKIYSILLGILLLAVLVLFLKKFLFFLIIVGATILVAFILRFLQLLKYAGVELVTLSTLLVGVVYGPLIGGIYGFVLLLAHLIVGNYYIGTYLMWLLPEYVLLGVLSGILGEGIIGYIGMSFIVGMNLLNAFLTFLGENERFVKELPFAIGNSLINSILLLQVFSLVVDFIA